MNIVPLPESTSESTSFQISKMEIVMMVLLIVPILLLIVYLDTFEK